MDLLIVFWIFLVGMLAGVICGVLLTHRLAVYPLQKKLEDVEIRLNEDEIQFIFREHSQQEKVKRLVQEGKIRFKVCE
jgi:uncharacterized protein YneF (UPF0154 family)